MLTRMVTWELGKFMDALSLEDEKRLRALSSHGWDWLVQTFNAKGEFCMETVHSDKDSRQAELRAIAQLGRTAKVVDLRPYRD
jgi:hypothetical protein